LRALRNYGFDKEGHVGGLGINAKMHEISAAMALSNLPHYDSLLGHNKKLHWAYAEALSGVPGVHVHSQDMSASNDHYVVIRVTGECPLNRDEVQQLLETENVLARRYFWPGCHRSPPYTEKSHRDMTVTEELCETILQLPTGTQLGAEDADAIARCIRLGVANAARARDAMRTAGEN
jgi:dTDP-4-amino-4,6-dideoxygalactose transaminase